MAGRLGWLKRLERAAVESSIDDCKPLTIVEIRNGLYTHAGAVIDLAGLEKLEQMYRLVRVHLPTKGETDVDDDS